MIKTASLGMPRIGKNLEIQAAIKNYLTKKDDIELITKAAAKIKKENWLLQSKANIDIIPSNDFSLADHVLDTTCLFGNIHKRYFWEGGQIEKEIYLLMINGEQKDKFDIQKSEINQWFNTRYFYYVPEINDSEFSYSDNKLILEYIEAKNQNIKTRPIILGPITYIMLAKERKPNYQEILEEMLNVYQELFKNITRININSIQIDEHYLCFDIPVELSALIEKFYLKLKSFIPNIYIALTTSYGDITRNLDLISKLPIDEIHFDFNLNKKYFDSYISKFSKEINFSLGVIDANNIWINDLNKSIDDISFYLKKINPEKLIIAPSSSLFLLPYTKKNESLKDENLQECLSFAEEKLQELNLIKIALNKNKSAISSELNFNKEKIQYLTQKSPKNQSIQSIWEKNNSDNQKFHSSTFGKEKFMPISFPGMITEKNTKSVEEAILLQKKVDIEILSSVNSQHSYFKDFKNILYLKSSIQLCNWETFNPWVILNNIEVENYSNLEKIIDQSILCKEHEFKINILGPISFINQGFLFYETFNDLIIERIFLIFIEMIKKINKYIELRKYQNIAILQFDEPMILTHLSKNFNSETEYILSIKKYYDKLLSCVNEKIKSMLYLHSVKFSHVLEEITRINFNGILIECASSFNEPLESFISYKYQGIIAIGMFRMQENKLISEGDISLQIKKTNMLIDEKQIIVSIDNVINLTQVSIKDYEKQIKNLVLARDRYLKYLEKIKID